jgi:uncharacterized protein (TIGR02145 family)
MIPYLRIVVILMNLSAGTAHAQLREFDITPIPPSGPIPVFRDHPEKVAVILRSSLTNLRFDSNLGVTADLSDASRGEYVLILDPVRQSLTVNAPGYQQSRIQITLTEARQVAYYRVEPKPEVATNVIPTNIQVTPTDAKVTIDGNLVDISKPVPIEVGTHKIRIEKQGFRTIEKEVRISADQNLIRETLSAIEVVPLTIKTQPAGATILIDGVQAGVTDRNGDMGLFRFPGTYELGVQLSGYLPETRTITVSETGSNAFSSTLVRNAGTLRLSVQPTDAIIYVNNQLFGTEMIKELIPGTYQLSITKSGFLPYEERLEVRIGESVSRQIVLIRNSGTLRLSVTPMDATVLVNRQSVDASQPIELAPGLAQIEVSKADHEPYSETVEILRGQTTSRTISLEEHLGGFQIITTPFQSIWSITTADSKVIASGTGLARKNDIPTGNYTLSVKATGHQVHTEPIRIARNLVLERTVVLKEGPPPCGSILSDIDGNVYKTVQIGDQCWMAENLQTSKYQDGSEIPNVTHAMTWSLFTNGAWAFYSNNSIMGRSYGMLYNWYAVSDRRNLCPVGWHVPSDDEWSMMSNKLGSGLGIRMKASIGWNGNGNGSNTSGFEGRPGGYRNDQGEFKYVGQDGYFWSSSGDLTINAWERSLSYDSGELGRNYVNKKRGLSIRCLRD